MEEQYTQPAGKGDPTVNPKVHKHHMYEPTIIHLEHIQQTYKTHCNKTANKNKTDSNYHK